MTAIEPEDRLVHRPGNDGVMGSTAYCGAKPEGDEIFTMHEHDYNCQDCIALSGEGKHRA